MATAVPSNCEFDAGVAHELLADSTRRAALTALAEAAPLSPSQLARLVVARDQSGPTARLRSHSERELELELVHRHLPRLEAACVVEETADGYDCGPTFDTLLQVFDATEELVG